MSFSHGDSADSEGRVGGGGGEVNVGWKDGACVEGERLNIEVEKTQDDGRFPSRIGLSLTVCPPPFFL